MPKSTLSHLQFQEIIKMSSGTPVLVERSTVFKTPTRCSSSFSRDTPVPSTPRAVQFRQLNTPLSARKTPGDRFIPSRAGADLQFSAYKVRSGRRRRAENCDADAPLVPDPDSARRKDVRERLFALRGRCSESRVLNFKQTTTGCAQSQKKQGNCESSPNLECKIIWHIV